LKKRRAGEGEGDQPQKGGELSEVEVGPLLLQNGVGGMRGDEEKTLKHFEKRRIRDLRGSSRKGNRN